jgi:hypothetical protein
MSRTIVCIDVRVVIQRLLTDRGRTLARCTVRYERALRQGVLNFLARGWQLEAAMIDTVDHRRYSSVRCRSSAVARSRTIHSHDTAQQSSRRFGVTTTSMWCVRLLRSMTTLGYWIK